MPKIMKIGLSLSKIYRKYPFRHGVYKLLFTSAKEIMFLPVFVCLFVCLSVCLCVSKITHKVLDRFF